MYLVRAFFPPNQGAFLWILKKGKGNSPLPPQREDQGDPTPSPSSYSPENTVNYIFIIPNVLLDLFFKNSWVIFSYRKIFGQTSWLKECHGLHFRETKAQIIMLNIFSSFFSGTSSRESEVGFLPGR